MNKKATAENWRKRTKEAGKGWEYHVSSLPEKTREYLAKKVLKPQPINPSDSFDAGRLDAAKLNLADAMDAAAEQRRREQSILASNGLTGKAAERDAAGHQILNTYRNYQALTGQKVVKAMEAFCAAYNRGEIDLPAACREAVPELTSITLRRWMNKIADGKSIGGQYGQRKGKGAFDSQEEVRKYLIGVLTDKPHISVKNLYDGLCARFAGREDIELPVKRSLERWVMNYKKVQAELHAAITNPDAWKNKYKDASGTHTDSAAWVNAKWEIDSTPADLELTDGRYVLIGLIDVHSKRPALLVSKTSRAVAVSLAVRRAIQKYGVPDYIKGDNGQEYVSKHQARVAEALGIRLEFSNKFSPWEKPHIERFFHTFSHGLASLLPGFIGHNVADRQAIRARQSFAERLFEKNAVVELKLTAAELQKFCDQWVDDIYMHDEHDGLGGKTPFQVAAECRQPIRRIDNERALDLLLAEAPAHWPTVQKKGIKLDNNWYIAPELDRYRGMKVQVLPDPNDLGRIVVYGYDRPDDPLNPNAIQPGLHFVCLAECPPLLGITREEHAEKAAEIRERQKQRVQGEKRKLKNNAKSVNTDAIVEEILEHKRQQAAAKVLAFPKKVIEHRTAALAATEEALEALDGQTVQPFTYDEVQAMRENIAQAKRVERPMFENAMERVLWLAGVRMGDIDAELSGEDDEFLRDLRRTNQLAYRLAEDVLNRRYEGRWEQYSEFRRAVGWPDARRPKG